MSGDKETITALAGHYDRLLREEFGTELFQAGWCLLLGRYYGQSTTIYFSLNPGIPRSGAAVDPTSTGEWNVPFFNPPELRREYVYLQNCQRFFESEPELGQWIQDGVTSAFLLPWRTRNLSELARLNAVTGGRVFAYGRAIAKTVIADHRAELIVAVGKAALGLMVQMEVVRDAVRQTALLGPGGSYQWSRWVASVDGRKVRILQIPHFSRANSPVKMQVFASWLRLEVLYSRLMNSSDEFRKRLLDRQEELKSALRQHGEDSLDSGDSDVQDEIDRVTTLEAKTAALALSTREFKSLEDVRMALQRLDEGTYGVCVVCGESIEEARLRAIPETPYCIRDAEALEKEEQGQGSEQTFLNS